MTWVGYYFGLTGPLLREDPSTLPKSEHLGAISGRKWRCRISMIMMNWVVIDWKPE